MTYGFVVRPRPHLSRPQRTYPHREFSPPSGKKLFTKKNRPWLENLTLRNKERTVLLQDLALLDALEHRITESNQTILAMYKENQNARLLRTIPGLGIFFVTLIAFEIDDINRFPSPKKFAAYAGIVPSTYSSGNKTLHGRITKQGNKFLRMAFVEAVWPAMQKDPGIRYYNHRIRQRRGANPAKVATARRLLSIAYRVLKEQCPYEVRWLPLKRPSDQTPGV